MYLLICALVCASPAGEKAPGGSHLSSGSTFGARPAAERVQAAFLRATTEDTVELLITQAQLEKEKVRECELILRVVVEVEALEKEMRCVCC